MKRLALVLVACSLLAACGAGSSKSVVLKDKVLGAYVQVTGPPAAAEIVARMVEGDGSLFATASATQGRQVCTRSSRIVTYPETQPSLRGLDGKTISIAIYGDHRSAGFCKLYWLEISSGGVMPLLGENLTASLNFRPFMEPTIHCSYKQGGCLGHKPDFVVVQPSHGGDLQRGAIVVFNTTQTENRDADVQCEGEGNPAIRRVVGLPGETVREDSRGYISIRAGGAATWTKLNDSYIPAKDRAADLSSFDFAHYGSQWRVPAGEYFVMSDNRSSCDSRTWGSVPAANIIGAVVDIIRDGKVLRPAGIPG